MGEIKRKYTGQVMNIAGCIKIVQEAMRITGKSPKEIDGVLETFTDSFTKNLDLQKIGEIFSIDKKQALENLKNEFRPGQNWTEKISSQERKEGIIMDARMYSVHAGNEAFYEHVSDMIDQCGVKLPDQVFLVDVIVGGVDVQPPKHIVSDDRGFICNLVQLFTPKKKKDLLKNDSVNRNSVSPN